MIYVRYLFDIKRFKKKNRKVSGLSTEQKSGRQTEGGLTRRGRSILGPPRVEAQLPS